MKYEICPLPTMRYINNPPNPWLSAQHEWIGEPPEARLEVFEETATRSIITSNNSPDIPFEYSVNCYRGCPHACTYCFSRPTHEYLGFGAGTDFERKIVAKVRAPELLREELMKKKWKGDVLVFSFTSDPYIPLEANYQLTHKCLEVCLEFRNPVSFITKSALIRRDLELIKQLSEVADVMIHFTIPFLDHDVNRALEPFAPFPEHRFAAMKAFADVGIEVGLGIAPVIPGLNEHEIPQLLERARDAGAKSAFINLLRLPGSVKPYFLERLEQTMPLRAKKIVNRIKEVKGGVLNKSEFGERMRGEGQFWEMIKKSFEIHTRRLGLNQARYEMKERRQTFRRPSAQGSLFDF
ncbi:MAG: PA0069 family radical SAM protein [Acidobacteria bacterium]|nr:PA0069 family radical SAM protein [Acidobacteriota bacterium]